VSCVAMGTFGRAQRQTLSSAPTTSARTGLMPSRPASERTRSRALPSEPAALASPRGGSGRSAGGDGVGGPQGTGDGPSPRVASGRGASRGGRRRPRSAGGEGARRRGARRSGSGAQTRLGHTEAQSGRWVLPRLQRTGKAGVSPTWCAGWTSRRCCGATSGPTACSASSA
jgi:hypothetical protein